MKRNKDIILLYWFDFFKSLQFFGAVAVPFYLHRVGLDYTRMFLLETVFSFCMIVLEIPTGVIADRWGRKISLILGSCFFGAGFLLFGIYTAYFILVIAEIICALGMTLLSGADRAILYEILKRENDESRSATVMARYDAWGTAGMLLAFPAGSLFVGSNLVPYQTALGLVFVATAMAVAISGFMILFVKEGVYEKSVGNPIRQGFEGFRHIFAHPKLRVFSLNYALISSMTFFMFWFYQSLLLENRFPVSWQGFIAAGFNFTAMLLLLATPVAERRIGVRNTLLLSSIIPGILYIGVSIIPGILMVLVAIFGVTNLKMFRAPLLTALMNEQIGSSNRATILSGVSMIERIATTLLYPLAGALTDISLKMTFLAIGIITVMSSIFLRVEESCLSE